MSGATDAAAAKGKSSLPVKDSAQRVLGKPRHAIGFAIGQALQAHYDDLVAAPMPDRFLVLLAELEAREKQRG